MTGGTGLYGSAIRNVEDTGLISQNKRLVENGIRRRSGLVSFKNVDMYDLFVISRPTIQKKD
jgi:hypothetical protein